MRPLNLKTRIFLDSGDPAETKQLLNLMGFLDGQTTNPTLIAKNPTSKARLEAGQKFSPAEILAFYRQVVTELSQLIPEGSVSIEVYADEHTTGEQMFAQGQEMATWIPNAHIKYPTTSAGLEAAERSIAAHLRVNMTLCFSQEQGAAIYAATRGAKKGQVFISPFVGRLVDQGENGLDLVSNLVHMYEPSDGHVEVLAASIRTLKDFTDALFLGADIITAPYAVIKQWAEQGMPVPDETYTLTPAPTLRPIAYKEFSLEKAWSEYDSTHPLTTKGIERFASDWNALIEEGAQG